MAPSKIDHKELKKRLKEDEIAVYLSEFRERTQEFWARYGSLVGMIVVIVALVVIIAWWWNWSSTQNYLQAQTYFGNATALVQQQNYQEALGQLNPLIQEHSDSDLIPAALVLRGNCYAKLGQYQESITDYRKAITMLDPIDAIPARVALVQSLRSNNQPQDALLELQTLEKVVETPAMKNLVAYLKGGIHEDLGQEQQALEAYRTVEKDSEWYSLALGRIDWLETPPVQAIN
ncbi:MAG: tetratricopeptide repeat protein [bacterium]|jgi:tetratricopeptide (TPR) repeat protein